MSSWKGDFKTPSLIAFSFSEPTSLEVPERGPAFQSALSWGSHIFTSSLPQRGRIFILRQEKTSPRTLLCCLNQLGVLVGGHCPLLSGCPSPCILGSRHPTSCDGTCSCFQTMQFPLPRMPFMAPAQQEDRTLSVPILWTKKLRPRKGSILPESIQLLSSRARI